MDLAEAARRLSVAEHEIVQVRPADGWWEALHHDMATHGEGWRPVPRGPLDAVADDVQLERDSGVEESPASGSGVIEWMLSKVPDGPAKDVLAWVGDDRSRALAAQVVEHEKEAPRVTLIAALEKVSG